ncbi:bZIP transcription factor [Legionella tunisiensis]|uniref:bZIP transcription factor n=1 Tax=Legionella tunisiensis TaxID=1034944 RepID=UPI0002E7A90F|nr:bZIP transcription factor [Legionella tunisiensis]
MDSPAPYSSLVGTLPFFPLPEKTGETSNGSDKYTLYEQKVQRLKARKNSLSIEEKQELRRLSNLLSARNSRIHKKEYIQELQASLAENTDKNKELQDNYSRLTIEQQALKEELARLMSMVVEMGIDPYSLLEHAMASSVEEEESFLQESLHIG